MIIAVGVETDGEFSYEDPICRPRLM